MRFNARTTDNRTISQLEAHPYTCVSDPLTVKLGVIISRLRTEAHRGPNLIAVPEKLIELAYRAAGLSALGIASGGLWWSVRLNRWRLAGSLHNVYRRMG